MSFFPSFIYLYMCTWPSITWSILFVLISRICCKSYRGISANYRVHSYQSFISCLIPILKSLKRSTDGDCETTFKQSNLLGAKNSKIKAVIIVWFIIYRFLIFLLYCTLMHNYSSVFLPKYAPKFCVIWKQLLQLKSYGIWV